MLKQALRELRFHPSRFVATLIAIAISVAFMVTSSIMVATQRDALAVDQAEAATLAEEFDTFRNLLWTFAGIAAVVGMITIANTFTILLAQRRRQIGLLRAVGAEGSQVRRRFFLEALLLGLAGSLLGVALGVGLSVIGASITGAIRHGLSVPAADLGIAFGAGLLITVMAAYLPVLRGTRVRPLEALQPEPSADERRKAGLVRAVVCGVLLVAGLALGLLSTRWDNPLLPAIAGSALVALGVLFGASLFVPRLLRLLGSLVGRFGVTPRLAAQNAVRNPRRASTTAAALMLAVGLVVTLQVGTATVRATMLGQIDHQRPVDVAVASWEITRTLPADLVGKLVTVPGVAASALLDVEQAETTHGGETAGVTLLGFDDSIVGVAADAPRSLADDRILVTDDSDAFVNGDLVTVKGERGTVELTAVRTPLVTNGQAMVSPAVFAKLGTGTPDALLWLSVPDRSQAVPVVHAVEQLADPDSYFISGGIQSAAAIAEVLDLLLYITTALLGVAVFIALVGVSNTLGLSVLERTRESALLRAVGLQARSLRVMMLVEALLLAAVAVAVGIVAGIYFGWLGARSLAIGIDAPLLLDVDVPRTTGMVVIAILAAALASVLPGRRAAKASPVEALADI